ncbi:MAG: DegV family protein [Firmicutes bacterium]|nr:DegV family protein [Bacillota bacterium]MDY6161303.1 DegV family protein [Candidatus Faecousia sp.]
MEKIRILTDSGSDICAPFPENLTVIPLTIHFGPEEYRDGETIDHKTFYEKLTSGSALPTTSLIPPGEFEQAYKKAQDAGETVIAIVLSSKLSGTYQSAALAAEGFDHVYVVDSLNATLGEQILVKYALQLVERGMSAADIAAELERAKSHVNLMGLPDTLEYLHRGGRVSKTVAVLGGALSIKPVLRLVDGVVVMIGKARGSKNGNNYLIQEVNKSGVDFSKPLCLGYTGLSDELLQRYIADSRQLWEGKVDTLPISTVGATIGTHVGPGAIVVAFFDNQ